MTTATTIQTPAGAETSRLKRRTLFVTSLGYFIVILDTTAKNVALPQIGGDLHIGVSDLQWIVDGYLVMFASLLLTAGALSDRYGARRLFAIGLAIFGAASLASAVAQTGAQLIAAQVVAGLGAALVTPASLALLAITYPDPKERGKAIGIWATVAGAGTVSGPLIGGLLTTLAGWEAVFLVNLPVAILGLVTLRSWLPKAAPNRDRALDLPGQVTGILALALLTYGAVTAGTAGWGAPRVWGSIAAALVLLVVFWQIEARTKAPMLPVRLLRNWRLSSAVLAGASINFGTYSQMFLLALYFQAARSYGALQTGIAELPMTLMCVLLPAVAGRTVARRGPRLPLALGLTACGIGALCLSGLDTSSPYALAIPGLVITGVGMAFAIPSVASAAMSGVNPHEAGAASGILNTARQTGGVLGVSILGAVVGTRIGVQLPLALTITAAVQLIGALVALTGLRSAK